MTSPRDPARAPESARILFAGPSTGQRPAREPAASTTESRARAAGTEAGARPPIDEARRQRRDAVQMFFAAIGLALGRMGRIVDRSFDSLFHTIGLGFSGLTFALASPTIWVGVEPSALWSRIRSCAVPVFRMFGAATNGVAQLPSTALGIGLGLTQNLVSGKCWKSWKGFTETLLQPTFGAVLTSAHSVQYREALGGPLGFLADYWADLVSNMLKHDAFGAYLNTRAEREAYALENDPIHSPPRKKPLQTGTRT